MFSDQKLIAMPPATWAEVVIDKEKCSGCGRCVKSCSVQLLGLEDKKAKSNERYDVFRCLTCQNCMAVCPENAIKVNGDYRVSKGFWKNDHLFTDGKSYPAPFGNRNNVPFEEYQDQLTDVEKVIYRRRSNRLYRKKPVASELIKRVIEAGRYSPSAGNNQPWKFLVIQNPEMLAYLNKECKKTLRFYSALCTPKEWLDKKTPGDKTARLRMWQKVLLSLLVKFVGGDADQRVSGGLNAPTSDPDFHLFFKAPTVIIILVDKRAIGGTQLDIGICAQNMVLAAHSLGLGTCYHSLISKAVMYKKKIRKKLGITDPFIVGTTIVMGYPQGEIDNIVKREKARVEWIT